MLQIFDKTCADFLKITCEIGGPMTESHHFAIENFLETQSEAKHNLDAQKNPNIAMLVIYWDIFLTTICDTENPGDAHAYRQ